MREQKLLNPNKINAVLTSNIGFVYIMTNKKKSTLYIGVTNNLCRRIYEHKKHININSFTAKYNLEYCIYFEEFQQFESAIQRENELKKWSRQKKESLINALNPQWKELVTENGFQGGLSKPFSQQLEGLIKELLPKHVKKDSSLRSV